MMMEIVYRVSRVNGCDDIVVGSRFRKAFIEKKLRNNFWVNFNWNMWHWQGSIIFEIQLFLLIHAETLNIKLPIYHRAKINPFFMKMKIYVDILEKRSLFMYKEGFMCGGSSMWNNFKTFFELEKEENCVNYSWSDEIRKTSESTKTKVSHFSSMSCCHHSDEIFLLSSRSVASLLNIQLSNKMQIVAHFSPKGWSQW